MQANTTNYRSGNVATSSADLNNLGNEWVIRAVAAVEVFGGLFGAGRATAILFDTSHPLALVALVCYLASVVAGVLLWQQSRLGFATSLIFQLVQIPWIVGAAAGFAFVSGPAFWVGIGAPGLLVEHGLVSWFHLAGITGWGLYSDPEPWHIGINLVAASIAVLLITNWPKRKRRGGN